MTRPPLYGMLRKHTCEKRKTTKSRAYAPAYSYCFISGAKLVKVLFVCLFFNSAPLFCRASLIAQVVKNPPAMQETPVRFLDWEYLLEMG